MTLALTTDASDKLVCHSLHINYFAQKKKNFIPFVLVCWCDGQIVFMHLN